MVMSSLRCIEVGAFRLDPTVTPGHVGACGTSTTPSLHDNRPLFHRELPMMTVSDCSAENYDPEQAKTMLREMMGPQAVDQLIRQAISTCWMMLPQEKKTVESVEREIRRLVDRALANLKEDTAAFGIGTGPPPARPSTRKPRRI